MPSGRTKGKRRKRNKSSPLIENSPKKSKSQKSDITNDISIRESDHDKTSNKDSDTESLYTSQSQPLFEVFETPTTSGPSVAIDPANISLPPSPVSPNMSSQDYIHQHDMSQDMSQGTGFDTQPPPMNHINHMSPMNLMNGMMAYQQSVMPGHPVQGHPGHPGIPIPSTGAIPGLSKSDILEIATFVKSMLQEEISLQVQQKVDKATESLKTELSNVKKELQQTKSDLNTLKKDNESLRNDVNTLQFKQDEAEQYSRRMCLRISGICETKHEDVTKKVLEFAKKVNSKICEADIDRAHRVGPSRTNIVENAADDEHGLFDEATTSDGDSTSNETRGREIIIKFTNSSARLDLLQCRSVLRDRKMKNVFINEDLTPARKKLAFECRRIKRIKDSKINKTWIYAGYPHIVDTAGNKVKITCLADLDAYEEKQAAEPMNT